MGRICLFSSNNAEIANEIAKPVGFHPLDASLDDALAVEIAFCCVRVLMYRSSL